MFTIDVMSRIPVYQQIIEQLETFVLKGVLKVGDQVPSVRSLSIQLSINPNTIQKAYTELDRLGIIYTVPGKGSFIDKEAMSKLYILKKNQFTDLKSMVEKIALAGVDKKEVMELINEVYSEKKRETV